MDHSTAIVPQAKPPFLDEVLLDYEDRHRRRIVLTGQRGHEFLLDLGEVPHLRDGDGIQLSSGGMVLVRAAPEPLMDIHAHDALHLTRIAWHIGNRHLAAEIGDHSLRIRADHVIAAMVEGLGGHVHAVTAPFNPEGGAYGAGRMMGHSHHHGEVHDDDHGHVHNHEHHHG